MNNQSQQQIATNEHGIDGPLRGSFIPVDGITASVSLKGYFIFKRDLLYLQ